MWKGKENSVWVEGAQDQRELVLLSGFIPQFLSLAVSLCFSLPLSLSLSLSLILFSH